MLLDLGYLLAAVIVGPFYLLSRVVKRKGMASPRRRLGFVEPSPDGGDVVWVHGVSVGEVLAARSLIEELRRTRPEARIVVTSTTVTGLEIARKTYADLTVLESPYDLSFAVGRFLDRVRPTALLLLELELWPNLLAACRRRGVAVAVANGKMSPRSLAGYRRVLRVMPRFLDGVAAFLMQDATYAGRLRDLGVSSDRITVTGNLKYDNVKFGNDAAARERLRAEHGFAPDAPIVIFGSTHPGEEAAAFKAMATVRGGAGPDDDGAPRFVVAPRHPGRVERVASEAREFGYRVGHRSRPGDPPRIDCLIVDTMGELAFLYGLADVAFVGGTLVDVGGHNLLEPAALGLPLVVGPHLHTVAPAAEELEEAGALEVVADAEALATSITRWLTDASARARASAGAEAVISRHKGSARRTIDTLVGLLAGTPDTTTARPPSVDQQRNSRESD